MFEIWWAYYQCEPFGSHWEQTATIASTVHAHTAMLAATRGVKMEPVSALEFVPRDSMPWLKRKKLKRDGIRHPKVQSQIIKRSFGFT